MADGVTQNEIIHGLMADPRYPQWRHLDMVTRQVGRIPEIVGESRLAETVTFTGIMQLSADMLTNLLARPDCPKRKGYVWRQIIGIRNGWLQAITMHGAKYDAHEPVIEPNSFGFTMLVEAEYLAGTLTFADLLRLQPGVFVPNIPHHHYDWEEEMGRA